MRNVKAIESLNSRNLCAAAQRATVKMAAHNGRRLTTHPKIAVSSCPKAKGKKRSHKRR